MKHARNETIYLFNDLPFYKRYGSTKKTIYLFFDRNSNETCKVLKDGGGYLDQKKFQKIKSFQSKFRYRFYICNELFLLEKNKNIDTCTIEYLQNIKFSNVENLRKTINQVNPLYPWKVFKKVYIVEKIDEEKIVKYDVKWQHYIE
jgi:hypothetical protein